MTDEPLLGRFEFLGQWWLDGHDDDKLTGTLTIDRGTAELILVGTFREPRYQTTLYRILGMGTDGDRLTLLDCRDAGTTWRAPGLWKTTHRPRYALRGRVWFVDGEDVGFDEVSIRTSDLEAWGAVRSFSVQPRHESTASGELRSTGVEVVYTDTEVITARVGDGAEVRIGFVVRTEFGSMPLHFTLTQRGEITYHSATRLPIDDATQVAGRLRNLLTLAVGRPVALLSITGQQKDAADGSTGEPTEVYLELSRNPEPAAGPLFPQQPIATLEEIRSTIGETIRAWLDRHETLSPVFDLYFTTLYTSGSFLEQRFIAYAQAVESYDQHRRGAPGDRFARRIRHVLNLCANVRDRTLNGTTVDEFTRSVTRSRNYYTHYSPGGRVKAATGLDLFVLTLRLRTTIEMILLREIGFDCDRIEASLDRAGRFEEIEHFANASAA